MKNLYKSEQKRSTSRNKISFMIVCLALVRLFHFTTKLSLGRNNDVITELFLSRGSLVSDIPAGDGKLVNLFYGVFKTSPFYKMIHILPTCFTQN
jgi:hypothetical protein